MCVYNQSHLWDEDLQLDTPVRITQTLSRWPVVVVVVVTVIVIVVVAAVAIVVAGAVC